jgi:hypothetical protein
MIPVRQNWTRFATSCRNLENCCNLDTSFPFFMSHYANLSNSFRHFNQFSVIVLNSIHPEGDPRAQIEQSGLWQSAQELVANWVQFIKNLNQVTVNGLSPFFPMTVKSVDDLYAAMTDISRLFFVGSLKSKISPAVMDGIRGELANLRTVAHEQILRRDPDFDTHEYVELVAHATSVVESLFLGAMPRYTVGTGEIMLEKMGLKIAIHDLSKLAAGMVAFDEAAADLRGCTAALNSDLSALFQTLGLPWDLRLQEKGTAEFVIEEQVSHHTIAPPAPRRFAQTQRSPRRRSGATTSPAVQVESSTTIIDCT